MHNSDFDSADTHFGSRQQRIADVMQAILPGLDAHKKKQRSAHRFAVVLAFLLFFAGGYAIGECFRPLTYSEKVIVQALIDHTAAQQKKPAAEVTAILLHHLGEPRVRDIKSHQFNSALMVLGQYIE
jgi:hypothetical protein